MCGITGFWRPGAATDHDRSRLQAMMDRVVHRGPDGRGMHLDAARGLAMGHTRLAVVDLQSGEQPLRSASRGDVLTLNGELYDYKLHRARLICDGAQFSTKTDAEIALHLYERHGLGFVEHLRGEFALALHDHDRDRLVLARDRFGVKPLYVAWRDGAVYWGSEIKAILAHPEITARLDPRAALHQLMQVMVPGMTAFEGIVAVRPGHMVVVERSGPRLRRSISRWWNAEFPQAEEYDDDAPVQSAIDQVRDRLIDAVRVRLEADVPVGCYLSGGLDSSSILGLASAMRQGPVKAFTIAFEDRAYDESDIAAATAQRAAADPIVMRVGPTDLYGRAYERTLWHAERTFYNTLGVAKWHMSRAVHQDGIKVVLTGEGADELFAGYSFFKRDLWRHGISDAERQTLRSVLEAADMGLAGAMLDDRGPEHPAINDLLGFTPSWLQPWIATLARVRPLLSPEIREQLHDYDPVEAIAQSLDPDALRGRHPLDKAQYTWIQTMLEGQILTWGGDRVDMANSMESRPPFLDHRLAEVAFRLPPSLRIRGTKEKWVLREAMRQVLPASIYEREKFAFLAPPATNRSSQWAEVVALVNRHLDRDAIATTGLLDPDAVARFLGKLHHDSGASGPSIEDDVILNHLLGIQLLHSCFVQGNGRPEL